MGLAFSDDEDFKIFDSTRIKITRRTIRFGNEVYQFRNVTGFSIYDGGRKKVPDGISKSLLIVFFLALSLYILMVQLSSFYWLSFLGLVSALIVIAQPERFKREYGFRLSLNSGESRVFITDDLAGVKELVNTIYQFMEEGNENLNYEVYITDNSVTVIDNSMSYRQDYYDSRSTSYNQYGEGDNVAGNKRVMK